MPIQPKQIFKLIEAPVRISSFNASGSSNAVTTQITSALSSAGEGGTSVPVQVGSSTQIGVTSSGTYNKVDIWDATTKKPVTDTSNNEIYGRLTNSGSVYTISYFFLTSGGVETSYTFPTTTAIDFEFAYKFDFARLPSSFSLSRNVYTDPGSVTASPKVYTESLTVSAVNTVNDLAKTPSSTSNVLLIVNGVIYAAIASHFSVSSKSITWSVANSGINLETTDSVIAHYTSNE